MIIIKYKYIILCAIIIAHNINVFAQNNLVPNPSFENTIACPNTSGQIYLANEWGILQNGGGSTPDLYAVCCTQHHFCGVPYHQINWGFQFPRTGNNYAGFAVINSSYPNIFREYIQSKLYFKLKQSHEYCVKFYVNLSDFQQAYIKTIGAYFDDGSVYAPIPYGLAVVMPQVYNMTQSLNDTVNWMKIEGSFVATGIEEFITIGNFFPDSLSNIDFLGSPTNWGSYYNIDDISVIDANLPAYAGNDTLIQPGDSVFIGRQPEIGLDEDCIWFVNGVPVDTVAGLWVQPDTTTTYVVQQTICGNVTWDTVKVSVDTGVGIVGGTHGLNRGLKVHPNPATNLLTIESPISNGTLSISNLLGQEVLRQPINDKVSEIDISKLGKGVYFVRVEGRNGFVVRKVMIE